MGHTILFNSCLNATQKNCGRANLAFDFIILVYTKTSKMSTHYYLSAKLWQTGVAHICQQDPQLATIIRQYPGRLHPHNRPFETLLRAIIGQQISVVAANKLWKKLSTDVLITPAALLALPISILRQYGLSHAKAACIHQAAAYCQSISAPDYFKTHPVSRIKAELLAIKGIGPWTVDMFLIFHVNHANIIPLGDIGLLHAVKSVYALALSQRDLSHWIQAHAARYWHPFGTIATWYLWRTIDPEIIIY